MVIREKPCQWSSLPMSSSFSDQISKHPLYILLCLLGQDTKIYASKCLNLQVIKLLLFDNITIFEQLLGIWHVAKIL